MKYKGFRTIAGVFGLLAWLIGLLTFALFLVTGITAGGAVNIVVGIVEGIVVGFLAFAFLYALSQFIYVILDIEQHTRATRAALTKKEE